MRRVKMTKYRYSNYLENEVRINRRLRISSIRGVSTPHAWLATLCVRGILAGAASRCLVILLRLSVVSGVVVVVLRRDNLRPAWRCAGLLLSNTVCSGSACTRLLGGVSSVGRVAS